MKYFFCAFLLLYVHLIFGQDKKGYFGANMGINFVKNSDAIIGGYLSGNGEIAPGLLVGMQLGVVKFQNLEGIYIPFQARVTAMMGKNQQNVTPIIFIEPGWGAYNRENNIVGRVQGGFVFYGGAGIKFPSQKNNSGAFLSAGFSTFGTKTGSVNSYYSGVGVRFGVML
jgi:hypothetical protein